MILGLIHLRRQTLHRPEKRLIHLGRRTPHRSEKRLIHLRRRTAHRSEKTAYPFRSPNTSSIRKTAYPFTSPKNILPLKSEMDQAHIKVVLQFSDRRPIAFFSTFLRPH